MSYLIKKDNKTNTITYMNYNLDGYKFTPKSKENTSITINEIVVINPKMIDSILTIKFNSMFKKLIAFISDNSDNSSNGMYALTEIERLKSILFHKYQKYISVEKQRIFYSKLNMLEQKIKRDLMMQMNFSYNNVHEYEEEQTQGRGR